MNFMFNWPFALKKDCLDLEAMMLLLSLSAIDFSHSRFNTALSPWITIYLLGF